ncbi:MAG TPA: PaaI family thioesterase [Bacteroidales bacterium]|nr:PaaI family thioesterase [Bacteroidales bacterium]HQQ12846.1 PaaI family thioesterase [Bacteroidales bacterium]
MKQHWNIDELNATNKDTLMEQLGIEYVEARNGHIKAKMPVDNRTRQPMGLLHGGGSLALAETVAGIGSALIVDLKLHDVRGSHVSANHIRAAKDGWVYAEANLLHRGRNTHIWDIEIKDEEGQLVSTCRLTNFIIPRRQD